MAGNAAGARKRAAAARGMTVEEYEEQVARGRKWCRLCEQWRPIGTFYVDRSRGDGRKPTCRVHEESPDRPSKRERRTMAAIGLAWCSGCRWWLPKGDVSKQGHCRLHLRERERAWYAAGGWKYRQGRALARRRGHEPVPSWWREEALAEGCAYCGAPATTLDHVIPVSAGGPTAPGNLVPACLPCNSRKKASDPNPWIDRLDPIWLEKIGVQPWSGLGALEILDDV